MAITTLGYIRDYTITEDSQGDIYVKVTDTTQTTYALMPTVEEVNDTFNRSITTIYAKEVFKGCTSMLLPPMIPQNYSYMSYAYEGCTSLLYAPVISAKLIEVGGWALGLDKTFDSCSSLTTPPCFPKLAEGQYVLAYRTFYGCTNLGGEMTVRSRCNSIAGTFEGTVKPITLYGDKSWCEALAATADNNNVSWSAWYDPITPVTNRGEGSRTTATDITRMIRNGVLAVPTYAPARMSLSSTDFLHEDEWLALVEAAQTIDNTITTSTHYTNLNKIEKAFGDAL